MPSKELKRYECPALLFGLSYPVICALGPFGPAVFSQYSQTMVFSACWIKDTWAHIAFQLSGVFVLNSTLLIATPLCVSHLYKYYGAKHVLSTL
jgi:hypothetical protein